MKKLFLLLCLFSFVYVNAQTAAPFGGGSSTPAKKKVRKFVSQAAPAFDSATYYYNLGWDNYKMDSLGNERFGPARYYWEKASWAKGKWESKNAALYRLGLMQQNGEGMEVNLQMAMDYYLKASGNSKRLGDPDAIKAIGAMYENGFGVDQNDAKALSWYQKAKLAGNMYVDEDIARLKDRMHK